MSIAGICGTSIAALENSAAKNPSSNLALCATTMQLSRLARIFPATSEKVGALLTSLSLMRCISGLPTLPSGGFIRVSNLSVIFQIKFLF